MGGVYFSCEAGEAGNLVGGEGDECVDREVLRDGFGVRYFALVHQFLTFQSAGEEVFALMCLKDTAEREGCLPLEVEGADFASRTLGHQL